MAKIKGLGGAQLDKRPSYVPDQKIIEYFTADRNIKKLLERLDPDNTLVPYQDTIVNEYRKVFCILLMIGRAQHIRTFIKHDNLNDGKLPFEGKPPQFPLALDGQDFFQRFQEVQWQFCAMPFTYNMDLVYNDARILPIMTKDAIGSGGSSLIFKVVINQKYDKLDPPGGAEKVRMVFPPTSLISAKPSRPKSSDMHIRMSSRPIAPVMLNPTTTTKPMHSGLYWLLLD